MKNSTFLWLTGLGIAVWLQGFGCECKDNMLGSESNPYPDQTPPKISFKDLADNATLVRLEQPICVEASDPPRPFHSPFDGHEKISGLAKVEVFAAGTLLGTGTGDPCKFIWKTMDHVAGRYTLTAVAYDSAGNSASASLRVRLAETILIEEIQLRDVRDNSSSSDPLEIEIHLFNASTRFLGCAGEKSGMGSVNISGTLYKLDAYLLKSALEPIAYEDLAADSVYFEVIENDIDACPNSNRGSGLLADDLVGKSLRLAARDLGQRQTFNFGRVDRLSMRKGRPQ